VRISYRISKAGIRKIRMPDNKGKIKEDYNDGYLRQEHVRLL